MIDDSDRSWKRLGELDPYYAVITDPSYHREQLDEQARDRFFASGQTHIERVLQTVQQHLDPAFRPRRALDFGCGVGRLVVPLAELCDSVVGVDVSAAMLEEARHNCRQRQINNAEFVQSDDQLSQLKGRFDFIHSYIVFQHIPRLRGEWLCKHMLDLLEEGGVGALHFTYGRQGSPLRRLTLWARKSVPGVNGARNLLRGEPFGYPMMQLNEYDLSRIFRLLQTHGCGHSYVEFSNHPVADTSALGAMIFFQKRQLPNW